MASDGTANPFTAYALSSKPSHQTPPPAPTRRRLSPAAKAASSPAAKPARTPSKGARGSSSATAAPPVGVPEKLGSHPLRLILLGHNPSEHAWRTGHYYSNPSNRLWPILIKTGIAPPQVTGPEGDDIMPAAVGVGFTDVGSGVPGTDSSQFKSRDFQRWQQSFYQRLTAHVKQASDSIGCVCGTCGAPALVAFTGKRHYQELLKLDANGNMLTKQQLKMCRQQQQAAQQGQPTQSTMLMFGTGAAASRKRKAALEGQGAEKQEVVTAAGTSSPNQQQAQAAGALTSPDGIHTAAAAITQVAAASGSGAGSGATAAPAAAAATGVPFGPQTHLPDGWPLPPATEVWVLTSTSGACPLTHEQREEPYRRLAARLAEIPWPRADLPRCCSRAAAEQV